MTLPLGDIDLYANNPQRLFVGVSVGNPNFQDIGVASILSTSTNSFYWGTPVKLVSYSTTVNSQASIAIVEKAGVTDDIYGYLIYEGDKGYVGKPFVAKDKINVLRPSPYAVVTLKAGANFSGGTALMLNASSNVITYVNNGTNKICGYATQDAVTNSITEVALSSRKIS